MRTLFLLGASAMAIAAFTGVARSQTVPSIADRIGGALIGVNDGRGFDRANFVQESYNIGNINAGVRANAVGEATTTDLRLGSINLSVELSTALAGDVGLGVVVDLLDGLSVEDLLEAGVLGPDGVLNLDLLSELLLDQALGAGVELDALLALGLAGEIGANINLPSLVANTNTGGTFNGAGPIATNAIGAVQGGSMAIALRSAAETIDLSTSSVTGGTEDIDERLANSAANTSNTAAVAAVGTTVVSRVGDSSANVNNLVSRASETYDGTFYAQRAYNTGDIFAGVDLQYLNVGNMETNLSGIGAVQNGNLSVGFDGSALRPLPATATSTPAISTPVN